MAVKQYLPPAVSEAEIKPPEQKTNVATAALSSGVAPNQTEPVGKTVPVPGIDWKSNQKTLVLFLSTTCHFCNESMPFYKRLIEQYNKDNVKLVAVFPQKSEDGKEYLNKSGVKIDQVYNSSLVSIGVIGTPTLLLVDEAGVVSESWRGKLSPVKEDEVIQKLLG